MRAASSMICDSNIVPLSALPQPANCNSDMPPLKSHPCKLVERRPYELVATLHELQDACEALMEGNDRLGIDLEGFHLGRNGRLGLVQVARESEGPVYLIDVIALELAGSKEILQTVLKQIFEDCPKEKLLFDVRADAAALYHQYGVRLTNVRDLQILYASSTAYGPPEQYLNGKVMQNLPGIERTIDALEISPDDKDWLSSTKNAGRAAMRSAEGADGAIWLKRPLDTALLQYAANDVNVLFSIFEKWKTWMPQVDLATLSNMRVAAQEREVQPSWKVRLVNMRNPIATADTGIAQQWLSRRGRWRVLLENGPIEVEEKNLEFVAAHQDASRDFPLPMERRSIIVNGIGSEVPLGCLQTYFQKFGKILYGHEEGQSAIIVFAEASSASAAIEATDHFPIGSSNVPVEVDWITPAQKFVPLYLPMKPQEDNSGNKRFLGEIKSLNHGKGQGFIACPQILRISGFDVFITLPRIEKHFRVGQEVDFRVTYYNGKPQAHDIRTRDLEERFKGTIKAFWPYQGWGCIEGTEVMNQFGQEVYFTAKDTIISGSSHALEVGTTVSFKVCLDGMAYGIAGTPLAKDVKIETLSQERFSGRIKSVRQNFSFIECLETSKKFGRDIYLPPMEGLQEGMHVSFKVNFNAKGPQAVDVKQKS